MAKGRPDPPGGADDAPTSPMRAEPTSGLQPQQTDQTETPVEFDDQTQIETGRDLPPIEVSASHPLSPDYPATDKYGRYEILGRLAVGGMAEVFLAREIGQHGAVRHVAVKRILPQIADDDTFVAMFLDEARLAMRLNHPTICHLYDLGELEGTYFLAMEWVNGVPLGRLIQKARTRGGVPVAVAVKIIAQVADALNYAHQARDGVGRPLNIVHRDVSPQNIMVRFDGVVKLLDFGIAKAATQTSQTEAGIVKGKFSYMSPEQCLGKPLDARSDIFGLGACLFEALTGKPAFRRSSDLDTMRAIVHEPVPSARMVRPDVPPRLDAIVRKALAKDAAQRYQTAGELYVTLERFLAEQGEFVHAMQIAQAIEQAIPGVQSLGPLSEGSSPSGRAIVLESGSRPTADLAGAEAADPTALEEPLVDIEVGAPATDDDEGATQQWGGDDLPSVVKRLQAEAAAQIALRDEGSVTNELTFNETTRALPQRPEEVLAAFEAAPVLTVPPRRPSLAARLAIVVAALLVALAVTLAIVWASSDDEEPPAPVASADERQAPATTSRSPERSAAAQPRATARRAAAPDTTAPVAPALGALRVASAPPGATVRSGEREGVAPVVWTDLPVGTHAVVAALDGHVTVERSVDVRSGETAQLTLHLPALPTAPEEVWRPTPQHRGARAHPTPPRPTPPRATPPSGTLRLDSSPRGARAFHGNRLLGETPLTTTLPAGTIRLRLVTPDGRTVLRSVSVRAGETSRAFLPLGG